jgi:hypothetical protein
MTTQFGRLLEVLVRADVAFVVIGGVALVTQGGARATFDPSLPFFFDVRSLASGLNFTLTTSLGDLDLLGEVAGVGGYAEAAADADRVEAFGVSFLVLSLKMLEASKRAAGRPKDLLDLAEIAALRDRDR